VNGGFQSPCNDQSLYKLLYFNKNLSSLHTYVWRYDAMRGRVKMGTVGGKARICGAGIDWPRCAGLLLVSNAYFTRHDIAIGSL
jgi:hypothetical protein